MNDHRLAPRLVILMTLSSVLVSCGPRNQKPGRELTLSRSVRYPVRQDLPTGAIARFGADVFRQRELVRAIALSPGATTVVVADSEHIDLFDTVYGVRQDTIHSNTSDEWARYVKTLRYSPDGRFLVGRGDGLSDHIRVWKMPERELLYDLARTSDKILHAFDFSPSGGELVVVQDKAIAFIELATGQVRGSFELERPELYRGTRRAVYALPDGERVMALNRRGWHIYARSGELLASLDVGMSVSRVAWVSDELAYAFAANKIIEVNPSTSEVISKPVSLGYGFIVELDYHAASQTLVALVRENGRTRLRGWARDGTQRFEIIASEYSLDPGGTLAVASGYNVRRFLIAEDGSLVSSSGVASHVMAPSGLAWQGDGRALWSVGEDGRVIKWSLSDSTGQRIELGLAPGPAKLAVGEDGSIAVSGSYRDGDEERPLLRRWSIEDQSLVWEAEIDEDLAYIAVGARGELTRAVDRRGQLMTFDDRGRRVATYPIGGGGSNLAGVSRDLSWVSLYEPYSRELRFWSVGESVELARQLRVSSRVSCAITPRESAYCASHGSEREVMTFALRGEEDGEFFSRHRFAELGSARVSPSGQYLAMWGRRAVKRRVVDQLKFWDLDRDAADGILVSSELPKITEVAFHPTERFVATAHEDGLIYVWDIAQLTEIARKRDPSLDSIKRIKR